MLYRRWIISILNKKWRGIFVSLYTQAPNKTWADADKAYNIPVTTYLSIFLLLFFFFFKKRYSVKTIILNYLILIVVIIFLWNNSTIIISKPIEFELCYMKLTALKVDPLIYKKSNENKSWKVLRWTCNEVNILVNTYSIKNSKCKKLQDIEIKINVSTHIDKVCKK